VSAGVTDGRLVLLDSQFINHKFFDQLCVSDGLAMKAIDQRDRDVGGFQGNHDLIDFIGHGYFIEDGYHFDPGSNVGTSEISIVRLDGTTIHKLFTSSEDLSDLQPVGDHTLLFSASG